MALLPSAVASTALPCNAWPATLPVSCTFADGFAASARAVYTACPTNDQDGTPPTFTTEVGRGSLGDQSLVITRSSDGVGRVVIHVVRIGNAVVVDLASDEGTGSTVMDLATETRENLADVTGATNELQS